MGRPYSVTRRRFLRIVAASGVSGVLLRTGWSRLGQVEKASESRILMGTLVNLTVIAEEQRGAQAAIAACLDRMDELERALSRFRSDSQLARLNRDGCLPEAGPELLELLLLSRRVSEASAGAFDATVKPVLDLYRRRVRTDKTLPSPDAVARALDLVDHRRVLMDDTRVRFARPEMGITLDGIAKGYIVDAGVERLRECGFSSVLVEAGGDLMASGEREAGAAWRTGIQSPRPSHSGLLSPISLRDQAVATSGDYLQGFTPDLSHHHIIDPRTGYSAPELASATVVAPCVALADALSTALMVAGPQHAARLLGAFPGCSATMVTKDLGVIHIPPAQRIGNRGPGTSPHLTTRA